MVRLQMVVVMIALAISCSNAEARGRRMAYQPAYTQYYNTTAPTYTTVAPVNMAVSQPAVAQPTAVPQQTNAVVQASGTATGDGVVQASAAQASPTTKTATPAAPAAVGSAQWKAEQSARLGSVQHLGGGFGGGSCEGNGFGFTPDQAIQNACFWGQRTPIQIGVARGANGYYATIFYQ